MKQLETFAAACDRCKYRVHPGEPEQCGQGRERFVTGRAGVFGAEGTARLRLWLCDACWLEVFPGKGGSVTAEIVMGGCLRFLDDCHCVQCDGWDAMRRNHDASRLVGPLAVAGIMAAVYAWRERVAIARTRELAGEPDWHAYLGGPVPSSWRVVRDDSPPDPDCEWCAIGQPYEDDPPGHVLTSGLVQPCTSKRRGGV